MSEDKPLNVVMLCTGNAARSVMGKLMLLEQMPDADVVGAGTHALEGLPMSGRTRNALATHGLSDIDHRSHQLSAADAEAADLIVCFAPEHVAYVRRIHPEASGVTATLHHLVEALEPGDDLSARVDDLNLADVDLAGAQEVVDPAGGDEADFIECADEIKSLIDQLVPLL